MTSVALPRLLLHLVTLTALRCGSATGEPRADSGTSLPDTGLSPSDAGESDAGDAAPHSDGGVVAPVVERFADGSIVRFLRADRGVRWWVEERLAPQPRVQGDFDLGPRKIVRHTESGARHSVWAPPEDERLVDACLRADDAWSAVGIDASRRVFVAHGDLEGELRRDVLVDPTLRDEPLAWLQAPRAELRVGPLSEASPKIVCDGDDTVISFMSEDFAVLVYRFVDAAPERSVRTLVAPATPATPYLPIGGSYDDFDAMVAPYVTHLARSSDGRVFVAWLADRTRVLRYNAAFGTSLDLVRDRLFPREGTYDSFVAGIDRDGNRVFTSVVGVPDVEDELFGLVVGETRVAVFGRHRRELGRDNVELHAMVIELDHDGHPIVTTSIDLEGSAIAQTAAYEGDVLFIGGTEGWRQNPSGRSVFSPGSPFLVRLEGLTLRRVSRLDERVPSTNGHAELRALFRSDDVWVIGGHENGPLTHTADSDPSRVRSDAWLVHGVR